MEVETSFSFGSLQPLRSSVRALTRNASGTVVVDIAHYDLCRPGAAGEFRRGDEVQSFVVRRRRRTADGFSVKVWLEAAQMAGGGA